MCQLRNDEPHPGYDEDPAPPFDPIRQIAFGLGMLASFVVASLANAVKKDKR